MGPPFAGSKKRRREPHNVDVKLVELYEDLASEKDDIRLKAAQALVSQFTPDQNPADEQIKKVLSRLFRGLCSSRKAARIGFSIALTEILTQVFSSPRETSRFGFSDALNLWESQSSSYGSESGQVGTTRPPLGRLFGAEAIIKSSVLFQPTVPFEQWTQVVDLVFELAQKKPWIREECGWIIYQCVYDLAARKMEPKYIQSALEQLCVRDLARSPEGVAIWLAAKDTFPNATFPSKIWKHDDPLDTKERSSMSKIMKESGAAASDGETKVNTAKSSGVWNNKLHFAWDAVLSRTSVEAKDKSKKSRMTFTDFWTEVVDNGLFAAASSDERKYWGFLLFNRILNDGGPQQASQIFTKNLMRCLTNQLAVEDRYLHRMAVKVAKAIQARVSKEPEFAAAAIRGLMGTSGTLNFDQATKTKTVEKIVAEANYEALEEIVPFFEQLIQNPGTTEEKTAASNRQFVAGLLLSIVRSKASANEDDAEDLQASLEQILSIFVRFAYFMDAGKGSTAPEPPLSSATQELLRNRINSSLFPTKKFAATLPYAVVKQIRDAAKSGEFGKFIIAIDEKLSESVKAAFKSLKKLSSREKKEKGMAAFKLLYSMTIMQVYNGDADAVSMLDELEFCYTKFPGDKETKTEDAGDASDALVEILLSFASKQSQLFRRMSEQVFGAFANQITENGLESLTSTQILEAKESLAGQQEMFEEQDDEGEEEGEDDDDEMMDVDEDELDSDVEVIEAGGSGSGSDSDEEEEEEEEEDNEEDAKEVAAFEAKLAAALGTHRADEDESDSDADMNDDEMDELDDKLVQVFRARRQETSHRKDKKDARENMVNFKNRVLDLLEIFVKKSHTRPLALDILLPLLRLSRRTSVKQIATKANGVLREYTKVCKGNSLPKVEDDAQAEALWELLRSVHKEASHSGPMGHATACSQASLLVTKVLVAHDKDAIAGVVDVYAATRKDQLMSTKCHVQPSFFSEWNNWCVSASKQLK
ncbi:DNA polymerase V [Penicillium expansum]|nr:DNA polymerase V [Penicillium expansum]